MAKQFGTIKVRRPDLVELDPCLTFTFTKRSEWFDAEQALVAAGADIFDSFWGYQVFTDVAVVLDTAWAFKVIKKPEVA